MRLGLVIGEIGEKNKHQGHPGRAAPGADRAGAPLPGQEKTVYEYYEKNPGALAELRAPIFEDKVVDFVLDKAKPAEKKVSKDELFQKPWKTPRRGVIAPMRHPMIAVRRLVTPVAGSCTRGRHCPSKDDGSAARIRRAGAHAVRTRTEDDRPCAIRSAP